MSQGKSERGSCRRVREDNQAVRGSEKSCWPLAHTQDHFKEASRSSAVTTEFSGKIFDHVICCSLKEEEKDECMNVNTLATVMLVFLVAEEYVTIRRCPTSSYV